MIRHDIVAEVRRSLSDPRRLCAALGLGVHPRDRQWQTTGVTVRCPRHGGVSCSVTRGPDRTVRVHCFACDFTGDALHLVAEVLGLDAQQQFRQVLQAAARLAHRWDLVSELNGTSNATGFTSSRDRGWEASGRRASDDYPPIDEVANFWIACIPCTADDEVSALLERRAIRPQVVDELGLARALPRHASIPGWATFRGRRARSAPWTETGHRLILPVFDALGRMRSVRAWCVRATNDPKRLPPRAHRAKSLVLACPNALALLATGRAPESTRPFRVVLTEGEPDFLTWATRWSDACEDAPAVFGVMSGAWEDDIAARIPDGARVIVRTHHDLAGDGYARVVQRTLENRCVVLRTRSV